MTVPLSSITTDPAPSALIVPLVLSTEALMLSVPPPVAWKMLLLMSALLLTVSVCPLEWADTRYRYWSARR